jgi:hypothetical protein
VTERTPEQVPLQAALTALKDLSSRVVTLTEEVVRLRTYGRRNRWFVVLDVILTVGLAVSGLVSVHATDTADRNGVTISQLHATQVSGCKAGNQTRAQEITLWTHLASVSKAPPHLTRRQIAANRREIAQLLAYIRMTFAPRDCRSLYRIR